MEVRMNKKLFLSILFTLSTFIHAASSNIYRSDFEKLKQYVLSELQGEHNLNPTDLYNALNAVFAKKEISIIHTTEYFKDKSPALSNLIQFLDKKIESGELTYAKRLRDPSPKFSACPCIGKAQRIYNALILVLQTINIFDQHTPIHFISLGSGFLLQDSLYLSALSQLGIKNITINLIDPLYDTASPTYYDRIEVLLQKLKKETRYKDINLFPSKEYFEDYFASTPAIQNIVFTLADPPKNASRLALDFTELEKTLKKRTPNILISLMENTLAESIFFRLTTNNIINVNKKLTCQICPLATKKRSTKPIQDQPGASAAPPKPSMVALSEDDLAMWAEMILEGLMKKEQALQLMEASQKTELSQYLKELGL
jgi:hypothetical protein